MLHVLSVAQQISAPAPRSGLRGLSSQIKGWLERDDIEAQVKRLNKHVKKCYIQFTAFSAARIEHASARIENTSVRVEQRLIVNSVEQQAKLQRLEGMMARVLVHTQFGQNVLNQTMEIIASDPGHQTLESQYLSVQVMRLLDSLDKYTASHYFHAEIPCWDPAKPFLTVSERPTSKSCVLHKILGVVLQIDQSPAHLSPRDAANMLLKLGDMLSSLDMQSEAMASDTFSVKLFRYLASRENCVGALPRLAAALFTLSYRYRYDLRHDLAVHTSQQSVELGHFLFESTPNDANQVLFLRTSNVHSSNLRAAGQIDAAISVARDALAICRSLLPKTLEFASTRPDWASQYPEYEFQAAECAESFFCFSGALSDASRHREAFLASKEGLEVVASFAGAIPPPSGSDVDAFFNHMCNMAEAGEFDLNFLADVVILTSKGASDPTWLTNRFLYFLFSDLSATQLDVGQTQNALETAERAVIKCRELQLSHRHTVQPRIAVAYALTTLSNCLAAVGRTDEGLRAAQEAAAIYAGPLWRGFYPWGYRPQEFASKAYHTLSLRLAASGHPDEALINAEKAVEEYRELVFFAVRHTPSLASGLRNLASRLWDVDHRDDSIATLKEAISLFQGVVDQLPHHLPALADALEQLAEYLSAQGDVEGSSTVASECALIRERLV
ncbi:hypothetical protein C8J57DRAFT_1139377, partial [Mycena rebaudengoi]